MQYDKDSFLAGLSVGMLLGREFHDKPAPAYLTFMSEDSSEFTLSVYDNTKHWDGTLYYSTDARSWSEWAGTSAISSSGGVLYLRGSGNSRLTVLTNYRWVLTAGKRIQCVGNIEYLLDFETAATGQHPQMSNSCCAFMFRDCTSLTSAPELPATTLAESCYFSMFYGCTSLMSAPELPATALAINCYYAMFYGCTSLTSAPELPATALASNCYYVMFYGCTSLTSAPELPATTLGPSCYESMFEGCTGLTSAPELPATALVYQCYKYMFRDCTSLTSAPKLPATTLATDCYYAMFYGCTGLTGVPELPATTLKEKCYYWMFVHCTNLKISETQNATYQYAYRIPTSGTGVSGNNSLYNMFYNTGGTFKGTPTINTTYYTDHEPIAA